MAKFILTHDSHELKKGDSIECDVLPAWLVGKVMPVAEQEFEVATPEKKATKKTTKKESE